MFDKIPTIKIGQIILRSIYPDQIEIEAKYYHLISCDSLVKKYLPGAYTENEEQALIKINEYIHRTLSGASVLFCIARTDDKKPIGYILCNSPILNFHNSNERVGNWTIDFWLHQGIRGKGIMSVCIMNILDHMQKMQIPKVFAYTDKENIESIRVLQKCNMKIVDETIDDKMYIFSVLLNKPNLEDLIAY
jgi:RimJ/RimL family protein N-acetyltransferase